MKFIITLLSSFHKEIGKCNPRQLYTNIEHFRPDVILEELSDDTFVFVYSKSYKPTTIEAIAIKAYVTNYPVQHYPVDTYPIKESDLFSGADIILKNSETYLQTWNKTLSLISKDGFDFLNSKTCTELLYQIRSIEEATLSELNDKNLIQEYNSEKSLGDKREKEMLENIYQYSRRFPYNRALFICGAQHRASFKAKIQAFQKHNELNLNWAFYGE